VVDVQNQVIVNAEAFGAEPDSRVMDCMLKGAESNLEAAGIESPLKNKIVSADTAYFSKENLKACEDHEVDAYIPDPKFRQRDIRFVDAQRYRRPVDKRKEKYKKKNGLFEVDDFQFDDETGKLMCPAGHALYRNGKNFMTESGCLATSYRAPKRACTECELRSRCMRNPEEGRSRQVRIFHGRKPGSITEKMRQKIDTAEGRRTYSRRLAIVEPVFGNIRAQKGMDRFTLRGKQKVNIQWMLYCIVHNLEKIAHFGGSYKTATV